MSARAWAQRSRHNTARYIDGHWYLPVEDYHEVREAAQAVVDAHTAVIEGVTPKHPNWCANDQDEYDARFSRWHSATRALKAVLPDAT